MTHGIYIHLPFCKKRCYYCDFYSTTDLSRIPALVQAIVFEIERAKVSDPCLADTVYVGGGTPSLLKPGQIARLLAAIRKRFVIGPQAEITLEANPDSVNADILTACKGLGINRLNLGIQSLDDRLLEQLGRCHRVHQSQVAIDLAVAAGFENLGIDLIYGIPGQTRQSWLKDLASVVKWPISHLSTYALTYEPGTGLTRAREENRLVPQTEKRVVGFYDEAHEYLSSNGWVHYEISNYARTKAVVSQHNQKYWRRQPYFGFGPAAHSFDGRQRWWNVADLVDFQRRIGANQSVIDEKEWVGPEAQLTEMLMLGLRCAEGVSRKSMAQIAGQSRMEKSLALRRALVSDGLLYTDQGDRLRPTPHGMLVADAMARAFLACMKPVN